MKWFRRLPEAPVTIALIVVNLLVYGAMAVGSGNVLSFGAETLIRAGSSVTQPGTDVTHWRWLTAAFIHVNLLHIVMNLWVLAQIGVLSERAIGRGLFAASYAATGVLGNVLTTVLATYRGQETNSAGASGAIMGLIGVAAAFAWRTGQKPIAKTLAWNIVFVLAVGFSLTARGVVAVDNAAHVGGLLCGAVIGVARARFPRPLPRWADRLLIGAAAVLTVVGFIVVRAYDGTR